jgi:hypothetical protein
MDKGKLREWISIVANVGVLAGLILVAVQIRQSSTMLQGSSYQTWLGANVELNNALTQMDRGGRFADGNLDSRELDEDSFMAFAMWNYSFFQMVQATNYMYEQGALDRTLWEAEIQRAAGFLTLPGVRELWDAGMKTQLTPEFVSLVETTAPTMTGWDWDAERGFHSMGRLGN